VRFGKRQGLGKIVEAKKKQQRTENMPEKDRKTEQLGEKKKKGPGKTEKLPS